MSAAAPRPSRGELTRRLILDTAEAQLIEHGFAGTHVEQVAGVAYVSVGTLYLHFKNKEGLYAAVMDRAQEVLFHEYLDPVFENDAPPWERISMWCHAYVRFVLEHPGRARLMAGSEWLNAARPPEIDERLRMRIRERDQKLLHVLEEADAAGELQGADPTLANRFVWASMYGICALNLRHDEMSLTGEQLAELVENGLRMLSGGRVPFHSP